MAAYDLVVIGAGPGGYTAAIRAASPSTPIVWGGYFPTLYGSAAINAPYVDYAVRGSGEDTFSALLDAVLGPQLFCCILRARMGGLEDGVGDAAVRLARK